MAFVLAWRFGQSGEQRSEVDYFLNILENLIRANESGRIPTTAMPSPGRPTRSERREVREIASGARSALRDLISRFEEEKIAFPGDVFREARYRGATTAWEVSTEGGIPGRRTFAVRSVERAAENNIPNVLSAANEAQEALGYWNGINAVRVRLQSWRKIILGSGGRANGVETYQRALYVAQEVQKQGAVCFTEPCPGRIIFYRVARWHRHTFAPLGIPEDNDYVLAKEFVRLGAGVGGQWANAFREGWFPVKFPSEPRALFTGAEGNDDLVLSTMNDADVREFPDADLD
jgi:hypothetical protein